MLVRENPWLQVHVSEVGAPHLVDPTKLEASARRLYGDAFDELWGELAPIPPANVHVVGDRVVGLDCFPTPGHAWHHVSYLDADGTLYAGDAAGVRIERRRLRHAAVPSAGARPRGVGAARSTRSSGARPARLALIHFGAFDDVEAHLATLRETLGRWGEWVEDGMDEQTFVAAARHDVSQIDPELVDEYERAAPYWHHFRGLERYWRKRREAGRLVLEGVRLEVGERDELERRGVRRLEHDRRSDTRLERLLPARRDDAPAVARRSPGNSHCGCGVTRSFPRATENSRNSSVMTAQTAWKPGSAPSVWQ